MDRKLISQKLESLRRCIGRIESRLPESAGALREDLDAQDIIALNLTRVMQMSVDLVSHWIAEQKMGTSPGTMGQTFEFAAAEGLLPQELADRLRKSVGFRNIVVHSYEDVDWAIVYSICSEHLSDFKNFARVFSQTV